MHVSVCVLHLQNCLKTFVLIVLNSVSHLPIHVSELLQNIGAVSMKSLFIYNQSSRNNIYSRTSIYRFSRGWRKQTMNAGKRLIRETTFFNKKSRTLSFASWQNFASIENMTFQDLRCFHGPRRLHFAHRKTL